MALKLKTAEERAAEIRAQSAEIEAAQKAKKLDTKLATEQETVHEQVDYAALAKAEEARAAELKTQVDALQMELDPTLRPKVQTETKPYVKLTELLSKHENAEDTLKALHDAIREGRLEGEKKVEEPAWPADMSHLTPQQRERTMREMEAGKKRSEAAAAQQAQIAEIRRKQKADVAQQEIELAKLKEKLAEAQATIAVLRHNPTTNEVFPTTDKVTVSGTI